MKRNFSSISINGSFNDQKHAVLLVCNHISWWDGIWALYVNKKVFKRKYHFMMLEEQLRKNWFFNYTGGYSVNRQSKTVIESINYSAKLLANKNNIILMFPQGKIFSIYDTDFVFEKGIEKIIQKTKNPIQIVFLANFIDYLSDTKPHVNMNIKEYKGKSVLKELETAYNDFYQSCIKKQITENVK